MAPKQSAGGSEMAPPLSETGQAMPAEIESAEEGRRIPTWVYLLLLGLLVFILLGVESLLNWLLPAG